MILPTLRIEKQPGVCTEVQHAAQMLVTPTSHIGAHFEPWWLCVGSSCLLMQLGRQHEMGDQDGGYDFFFPSVSDLAVVIIWGVKR